MTKGHDAVHTRSHCSGGFSSITTVMPDAMRAAGKQGWVHAGVAQPWENLSLSSQDRTPYHADGAEVRPGHTDPATPIELNERYGSDEEPRPELFAVHHEVVRQVDIYRHRWKQSDQGG